MLNLINNKYSYNICNRNFISSIMAIIDRVLKMFVRPSYTISIHLLVYDFIRLKNTNWDWFLHNYR